MRNRSENQIDLLLIRHGATKSNKEHRYLGKTQESLSSEGKEALLKIVHNNDTDNLIYTPIDMLFTSPMTRCIETAKIIYPNMKPVIIPEWEEMNFGDFEGKNYQDLKDDMRYQEWIDSNGTWPFPNGESKDVFIARCMEGYNRMCDLIYRENQLLKSEEAQTNSAKCRNLRVGVVAHGGTIMALISTLYGGEYFDYQVSNGGGYRCKLSFYENAIAWISKIDF